MSNVRIPDKDRQREIGRWLKQVYDEALKEPVPDDLARTVERLQ